MRRDLRFFGERFTMAVVFCVVNAVFFLAAWQFNHSRTPTYRAAQILIESNKPVQKALFSPDDNIEEVLLALIDDEKEHISMAAFSFTSALIAQALMRAASRGVKVEVVADGKNSNTNYSKVHLLEDHGVPVWVYPGPQSSAKHARTGIMHHKFLIFRKTLNGRSLLCTGSYNFTRSANDINQENVIIVDDPALIKSFTQQFEVLKKRSRILNPTQC